LIFGRKPDLVTALITRRKDRSFEVQYIGDDSGSPKEPKPAATLGELRATIDHALVARYGEKLAKDGMGVGYVIYPWRDGKVPKPLTLEVGTDFLMFDLEEIDRKFRATESKTGLATSADSLDALVTAVADKVGCSWPSLLPEVPGALNWQRVLTASGFVPLRR
jgi:hypothetical protein